MVGVGNSLLHWRKELDMNQILQRETTYKEAIGQALRVRYQKPLFEKHLDYSESWNVTHSEIMDALFHYELGKLSIPKAFGWRQVPLDVITETIQSPSYFDAFVSLLIAVQVTMDHLSDSITEEVSKEIYTNTKRFVIGAIHSDGTAIPENTGARIIGHWAFISGSRYADWFVCSATIKSDDVNVKAGTRMFFVPAGQCRVLNTWDTLGMRGTGSNDFECQDVWVSEKLSVNADLLKRAPAERKTRKNVTGYYDLGTIVVLATVCGIYGASLELFRDSRKPSPNLGINSVVSEKVGWAFSLVCSAKLLLNDAITLAILRCHLRIF